MKQGILVYDLETLKNLFTYTDKNVRTKEKNQFVIWKDINDLEKLIEHVESVQGLIGFNNLDFDYPVLHYILVNQDELKQLSADEVARKIYKEAQRIIKEEWSAIKDKYVKVPQLDLFKIWHYDNVARMTSLKKLQISLRYPNVQDMPYKHYEEIENIDQVNEILDYNENDVDSTMDFYFRTEGKLDLRRGLYKKYGLRCMNMSDTKIGEELMLLLYCKETGDKPDDIRKLRTYRDVFKFSECLPEYTNFSTPDFNQLIDYLKGITVTEIKGSFKYSFEYKGFTYDLGTGGIHGCIKSGFYKSENGRIIVDVDVKSLYPSLAIVNKLYPEHLGCNFVSIYDNGIVKPRLKAKFEGDSVMADGFKLSANSVYGKSNSAYSWLCDPLYTLKTTLAGQISICMLCEDMVEKIDDLTILQVNTDGVTVMINESDKRAFYNVCKAWEKETGLELEYVGYDLMVIRDVNNYLSRSTDGKIKRKGAFVTYSQMLKEQSFHKSISNPIVPEALEKYYIEGIPVEKTIMECTNIYDFCKSFNATHGWSSNTSNITEIGMSRVEYITMLESNGYHWFADNVYVKDGNYLGGINIPDEGTFQKKVYTDLEEQQKNNRYYISTNGKYFSKTKDGKIISIEAGDKLVTIFNTFEDKKIEEYNIDYDFYIKECYKIIHKIDGTEDRLSEEARLEKERIKEEKNLLKEKELLEKNERKRIREENQIIEQERKFIKYCIDRTPTVKQLEIYGKPWLIQKYGTPKTK